MYRIGDIVIKVTGGNKMSILDKIGDSTYRCIWYVDKMKQDIFNEDEIIPINEYHRLLKIEERNDKLNRILESN